MITIPITEKSGTSLGKIVEEQETAMKTDEMKSRSVLTKVQEVRSKGSLTSTELNFFQDEKVLQPVAQYKHGQYY